MNWVSGFNETQVFLNKNKLKQSIILLKFNWRADFSLHFSYYPIKNIMPPEGGNPVFLILRAYDIVNKYREVSKNFEEYVLRPPRSAPVWAPSRALSWHFQCFLSPPSYSRRNQGGLEHRTGGPVWSRR